MKILGALVAFILMFVLIAGELILHPFIGLQLYELSNKIAAEELINKLVLFINNNIFTKYSSYFLKPSIRILYYVLIIIVIALIFSFNSRLSVSLKEVGIATIVAAVPYTILSYGFFLVGKRFPQESAEYFKTAFKTLFKNTALWALAGGFILLIIGSIIKKIEKRAKNNRRKKEKQRRKEEWKNRFVKKEKSEAVQPAEESEVVEE